MNNSVNMYAQMLIDEAQNRGIGVDIVSIEDNLFRLSHNGRSHLCRESLTDRSSAIDVSRVRDKHLAYRMFKSAGFPVPDQIIAATDSINNKFLKKHGSIVVKPASGEQGLGVSPDIRTEHDLSEALESARQFDDRIVLEEFVAGIDLRFIVIDFKAIAAAVRTKPEITGDGVHTISELVEKKNNQLIEAGKPQFRVPKDKEYYRILAQSHYQETDIIKAGKTIEVRKAANVHAGGVKYDVTDKVHPSLFKAAEEIAKTTNLRVTGIDLMVQDITQPDYVIIEAGERPSLYNHDKQEVIQRFMDSLFPETGVLN